MNIPNEAVYGSIGTVATIIGWAARQFVLDSKRESGERRRLAHPPHPPVVPSPMPPHVDTDLLEKLNVREYKQIISCIEEVFNGRYLLADEAREEFRKLESGMDSINFKLAAIQHSASHPNKNGS